MGNFLDHLLRHNGSADTAAGDEQVDPRTRDADGKQLAQNKTISGNDLAAWDGVSQQPNLDLDLASTERRRAARSRTRNRR